MSAIIGYVSQQNGSVLLTSEEGKEIALATHMAVHENDLITTGDNGGVVLVLDNGNTLRIGPNQTVLLDATVFEQDLAHDETQAEATAMQQALAQTGDIGETTGETAAGTPLGDDSGLVGQVVTDHIDNPGYAYAEGLGTEFTAATTAPLEEVPGELELNLPPMADPDLIHAQAGGFVVSGDVSVNDSDPDGDNMTFRIIGELPEGLTFHENGTFEFDPSSYDSKDIIPPIQYEVSDGKGGTDTSLLSIILDPKPSVQLIATDEAGNELANSTVEEGETAYYKAVLVDPDGNVLPAEGTVDVTFTDITTDGVTDYTYTVNNVAIGEVFSADAVDDVWAEDTESFEVSISNVEGITSYENVGIDTANDTVTTVTTDITDDSDVVTATLTATPSTGEDGGLITYTVTLTNADGMDVTAHDGVSFTLANGEIVNSRWPTARS